MRKVSKLVRIVAGRIYRRQLAFEFPPEVLTRRRRDLPPLPAEFEIRQPPLPGDMPTIAAMLEQDPGFGAWTPERVQTELLDRLAHPLAATLILHRGVPAATFFATDASTRRRRVAHGMFLFVAPAYRGRGQIATYITIDTLAHCVDAGYQRIMAYTDPERLSALLLHLTIGVVPVHDTISSYWQWPRVLRRLAPALNRLKRANASRIRPAASGSRATS